MNFEKFTGVVGRRKDRPYRMKVGQIVVRDKIRYSSRWHLEQQMIELNKRDGWEFSVAEEGTKYAIRRDK